MVRCDSLQLGLLLLSPYPSFLPTPLQVTRQVSSLCSPTVVRTLNEFVNLEAPQEINP